MINLFFTLKSTDIILYFVMTLVINPHRTSYFSLGCR